ncbi:MAG: alpha-ribazole phosphatase [Salinivirgaceae bacterium]|nr:alpha-ribazole phosphatase [Salinivirgaceae bacterium]
MHLYLVRHTQVDVPRGMCYGRTEVGLAKTNLAEFGVVAKNLEGIKFKYVYSSPLLRCLKLANFLNEKLDLPKIIIDDRLQELNFGVWETKLWSDIEQMEYATGWFHDFVNIPCPNGESYLQLISRAKSFIHDFKMMDTNNNILIVTHGGVVRAINLLIKNIDPLKAFDLEVDYGQIIKLEIN